ncbi:MAG TPA: hypothetical protein VIL99_16305 [Ignavibacteria bacterium]
MFKFIDDDEFEYETSSDLTTTLEMTGNRLSVFIFSLISSARVMSISSAQ